MSQDGLFSPGEKKVIEHLLQGKGNKQIALALGISERTVEFHLNHIYSKLNVSSRGEAIVELTRIHAQSERDVHSSQNSPLGVSTGGIPEESTVAEIVQPEYKNSTEQVMPKRKKRKVASWIIWSLLLVIIGIAVATVLYVEKSKESPWRYEKEAEFPDYFTVGKDMDRTNASGEKVHGQFGTQSVEPWSPQAGLVEYYNIEIPKNGELYLQLRYSKYSRSWVPILVYLDDEPTPRASIYPIDQGDWNNFTQTDWVSLGKIKRGVHTLRFFTNGEQYGVADLDKFILTTEPP